MKLTSSIFATLLAFTYGQNTTEPTMPAMDMTSTMLYTSSTTGEAILTETLEPELPIGDDPTDDDENCPNFSYMGTLQSSEDIELTICGYTDGEGDEAVDMVGITIQVPKDVWVLIGFKNEEYPGDESTEEILSGYNILIPLYSRDFKELYYGDDGEAEELQYTLELYSDQYSEGMRVVRFLRKAVIDYAALGGDESDDIENEDKYFDFNDDTMDCQVENTATVTFANKPNTMFDMDADISGYDNKFGQAAKPQEVDGDACTDESKANYIPILVAVCIGILAILF